METLIYMGLGFALGKWVLPGALAETSSKLQTALTVLLIFTMGLSIGRDKTLLGNLGSIGLDSLLFCLFPMVLSVAAGYLATKVLFEKKEER